MSEMTKMPEPIRAFAEHAKAEGHDTAYTYDTERSRWVFLNPMTADLWRYWQEATRLAMERMEAVRHAGAILSNCAFNLAQRNPGQFTARDIEALDSSRKAWDEALRALADVDAKEKGND